MNVKLINTISNGNYTLEKDSIVKLKYSVKETTWKVEGEYFSLPIKLSDIRLV